MKRPMSQRPRKLCHKNAVESRSPSTKQRAAGMAVRKLHEKKGGQREYEKANVPTAPEALPQKRGGEQKPQHKAEGRRDGSPEALCHDAALIGISAAQRHRAGVNGRLHLRDLLFPQAGGLGNGQGFTQIVRGQGDLHRIQPVPAQHGQRQLSHPAGLLRTVRVEALPIQEQRRSPSRNTATLRLTVSRYKTGLSTSSVKIREK